MTRRLCDQPSLRWTVGALRGKQFQLPTAEVTATVVTRASCHPGLTNTNLPINSLTWRLTIGKVGKGWPIASNAGVGYVLPGIANRISAGSGRPIVSNTSCNHWQGGYGVDTTLWNTASFATHLVRRT